VKKLYIIERETHGIDRYEVEAESVEEAMNYAELAYPDFHEDLVWGDFEVVS
jgi:hypothetical protein